MFIALSDEDEITLGPLIIVGINDLPFNIMSVIFQKLQEPNFLSVLVLTDCIANLCTDEWTNSSFWYI